MNLFTFVLKMLFFKNIVSQSGNTCYHEKGSTTLTNIPSSRLCGLFFFLLLMLFVWFLIALIKQKNLPWQ